MKKYFYTLIAVIGYSFIFQTPVARPEVSRPSFVDIIKKTKSAVVNISTRVEKKRKSLLENRRKSLGSGFIISKDGYILTTHSVIAKADKVIVSFSGKEYSAIIVGADKSTDIALLKIEVGHPLPVLAMGDSDKLEEGEWVIAIGNPFGRQQTMTAGIVSSKGRRIGRGPYDDLIQTDAAINAGNVGGPLINTKAHVVGINVVWFEKGGINLGVGFANPINSVKMILDDLKEKGKVTRGWLGVVVQRVTPAIAESFGLDRARGALVANVSKDAPADKAGIKVGDVIIEFGEKKIASSGDLPRIVASLKPGTIVPTLVFRDGNWHTITVTIGELLPPP